MLNEAGVRATAFPPEVVKAPGPGRLSISAFDSTKHRRFSCVLEFAGDVSVVVRRALAQEAMRMVPAFRAYVNDAGELVCTIDLMVEHGALPSQLTYTYQVLNSAMETLVKAAGGGLRA